MLHRSNTDVRLAVLRRGIKRPRMLKALQMGLAETEEVVLPARTSKKTLTLLAQKGLAPRYCDYHEYIQQAYASDNPTVRMLVDIHGKTRHAASVDMRELTEVQTQTAAFTHVCPLILGHGEPRCVRRPFPVLRHAE